MEQRGACDCSKHCTGYVKILSLLGFPLPLPPFLPKKVCFGPKKKHSSDEKSPRIYPYDFLRFLMLVRHWRNSKIILSTKILLIPKNWPELPFKFKQPKQAISKWYKPLQVRVPKKFRINPLCLTTLGSRKQQSWAPLAWIRSQVLEIPRPGTP